jgi:hypothetical protein
MYIISLNQVGVGFIWESDYYIDYIKMVNKIKHSKKLVLLCHGVGYPNALQYAEYGPKGDKK